MAQAGKDRKEGNVVVETLKTLIYALLIAGLFRMLFFQPFWIPSASMKDTLLIGDFLFVNKMAYGYSYASCPGVPLTGITAEELCGWMKKDNGRYWGAEPERGDVIVFRHPVDGREFIKRLTGLPGDRIQMKNGGLYINGSPVQIEETEDFVETKERQGPFGNFPRCSNDPVGTGGDCHKSRAFETLPNGVRHSTLSISNTAADNTGVFTVPEGHYFMMGDNRDNSSDSRMAQISGGVGFVPYEDIVGRADRIIFSSSGRSLFFFWTWRRDRFFKAVE